MSQVTYHRTIGSWVTVVLSLAFCLNVQPVSVQAADCGQPPLPPCQGQGTGEDQTSGTPSSSTTSGTTPSGSNSATSCGQPPLPPCSGQGVGQSSSPPTATITKPPSPAASSSNAADKLSISLVNPSIRDQTTLEIRWETHPAAGATVHLVNINAKPGSDPNILRASPATATKHTVTMEALNPGSRLQLWISASTTAGETATYYYPDIIDLGQPELKMPANWSTYPGASVGFSSDTAPQPETSTTAKTAPVSSFEQALQDFLRRPLLTLGQRTVAWADLLRWLLLLILALATVLEVFFFLKRRRLWGVVYDARTKQPVEMAVIRLFDQEHHKLLETRVTPKSGRYSFLGEPGEYYLDVTKEGYHFPSRIVTGTIDNEYTNIYLGHMIKLGTGQSLIAPDVPVDSEAGDVQKPGFFRRVLIPVMDRLRFPILLLAVTLALVHQFFLFAPLAAIGQSLGGLLSYGSLGLVVILVTIEVLFVHRGRK